MTQSRLNKKSGFAAGSPAAPDERELELINSYTRRELSADEVYIFSAVLCDNDVDRDGERFTDEALYALSRLFVGKTGIFDHEPSAKNQAARIISCAVEPVSGRKTATGDNYLRLSARAYIPRSKHTEALIEALDGGIIKEISVGCSVRKTVCSVCKEELGECRHQKGERYNGVLCCGELTEPLDAYEFSFVAVPAQRAAGVIKSVSGKEDCMESILKQLSQAHTVTLSERDCRRLAEYIEGLRKSAADGVFYRRSLTDEVVRLSATVQPGISRETMESVAGSMTVAQLREFKHAFEKQRGESMAITPQLYRDKKQKASSENGQFTI